MKIVEINTFTTGSTGRIMIQIAEKLREMGGSCYTFSSCRSAAKNKPIDHTYVDNKLEYLFHYYLGSFLGEENFFSLIPTLKLIFQIKQINPDIIHIHNIHGYWLNLRMFLKFLKKYNRPIVWTLHDCWLFTGRCPYFLHSGCNKWKVSCNDCMYGQREYPQSRLLKREKRNFEIKKRLLSQIQDITFVTPSHWLGEMLNQSFLSKFPRIVINNGIDTNVFSKVESYFREKYKIAVNEKIILAVASAWTTRKGLDDIIYISSQLDGYRFVLVGTNDTIDQKLPSKIISIHRTENTAELVDIYNAADVFINPTYDDNYPTVNIEALSCGCPVVTYRTGGSPEAIVEGINGIIVSTGDRCALREAIVEVANNPQYHQCSSNEKYSKELFLNKYLETYKDVMTSKGGR